MNGIENSRTKPWKMETTEYCSPEADMMIGSVVSIEVTPPAAIGDNGPETFTRNGDKSNYKKGNKQKSRNNKRNI